jgi:hypothetical protein
MRLPEILEPGNRERAVKVLRGYFSTTGGVPDYTGSRFDDIGHVWNDPKYRNILTTSDLAALSTLSVPVTGKGSIGILAPGLQAEATTLLEQIPVNASIGTPDAYDLYLARDRPAWHLWHLVSSVTDFGPVSTSKLLARKRASLVPIYDKETAAAWDISVEDMWRPMHEVLAANGGALISYAQQLAVEAEIPTHVAPLRVIDALVWKHQKDSH